MKRIVAVLLFVLMLQMVFPSASLADLGLYVNIASKYALWAANYGIDFELKHETHQSETDPSRKYLTVDRMMILYRPGDMQAESAALLYMPIDDQEDSQRDNIYRAISFIEAVEGKSAALEAKNVGTLFIMDIEQRISRILDEGSDSLLAGEEVPLYTGENAAFYLAFLEQGLVIVAR